MGSSVMVVRMKLCIKQHAMIIRDIYSIGWYALSRKIAHLDLINPKHHSITFLSDEYLMLYNSLAFVGGRVQSLRW